ncbi:MAG: helix-turn-helix domain-containing protein [Treponema sp.]|nr:helix-turn-helix domain-containing protein [Treponema sp.]
MHRSTLLYRLQRIQKITGLDVERSNNRWFLLLSFKLLENEQKKA